MLNKKQKKSKKKAKLTSNNTKPTTATTTTANASENNGTVKKATVLELLELQARARAIRSQLALEPVTKIELDDSDVENVNESSEIIPAVVEKSIGIVTSEPNETQTIETRPALEESPVAESIALEPVQRPIRLKRNFRTRQAEDDDSVAEKSTNEPEKKDNVDEDTNGAAKDVSPQIPEKERSPSPDIIPIIKEPEILCISSSDESDNDDGKSRSGHYIKMPTVAKENRPETEDEIFLRKVKESALGKNTTPNASNELEAATEVTNADEYLTITKSDNNGVKNVGSVENSNSATDSNKDSSTNVVPSQPEPDLEPEEGEIIDDDVEEAPNVVNIDDSSNSSHNSKSSQSSGSSSSSSSQSSSCLLANANPTDDNNTANTSANSDNLEAKAETALNSIDIVQDDDTVTEAKVLIESIADDEEDDDIIDLGKDEDLDFDLACESPPKKRKPDKESADKPATSDEVRFIFLSNNTNYYKILPICILYQFQNDSWGTRWLRGRKVSTVLAASKLHSKLRSKIKEKKKEKTIEPKIEEPIEMEKPAEVELPSNIEVGSVEHYNELMKNNI